MPRVAGGLCLPVMSRTADRLTGRRLTLSAEDLSESRETAEKPPRMAMPDDQAPEAERTQALCSALTKDL